MKNEENSFVTSGQVFMGVELLIWAPCIPKTKSPLKTYSYFLNRGTKLKLSHRSFTTWSNIICNFSHMNIHDEYL